METGIQGAGVNGLDELRRRYPWPDTRPDVIEDWTGWFYENNREMLRRFLTDQTRVVIELGSLCGLSSRFLAETAPCAAIICIDHWNGSAEHQGREGWDERLRELYPRFLRNLWPWRDRVIPMRTTTLGGMQEIVDLGVTPDLIYVDAGHDTKSVQDDVSAALSLFPKADIVGDDWLHASVRLGVVLASLKCKFLRIHGDGAWHLPVEGRG